MVNKSMIFGHAKTSKNVHWPQNTFVGDWNMKNLETRFQILNFFEYGKDAHKKTMQNGSSTFANELMRFRNEAKPIWVEIQKHGKMQSQSKWCSDFLN